MKNLILLFVAILAYSISFSQPIEVSENLELIKVSDNCYMHKQKNNNGLVYVNGKEAIIVSTPESDIETQILIDYIRNELNTKIVAYIIDRWHTDAMEGLDVVQKNEIPAYAFEKTRSIANQKGLPVPENGFDAKLVLQVNESEVIAHFLGEAHTNDGIVVYVPEEKVLFAGNGIRNFNGWVGNIGDANLETWSETAKQIKKAYGEAKVVIPGHGKPGGQELIDYTIELYDKTGKDWVLNQDDIVKLPDFGPDGETLIHAETLEKDGDKTTMKGARIFMSDGSKCVKIEAPEIVFNSERVEADSGMVEIYDLVEGGGKLRIKTLFNGLIAINRNDAIGLVVILKDFVNSLK